MQAKLATINIDDTDVNIVAPALAGQLYESSDLEHQEQAR
jgi:hypothetical protein